MRTAIVLTAVAVLAWLLLGGQEEPAQPDRPTEVGGTAVEAPPAPLIADEPEPAPRLPELPAPPEPTVEAEPTPPAPRAADEPLDTEIAYQDGGRTRRVWLNPRLMAEFGKSLPHDVTPQPPVAGARLVHRQGGVFLWRLEEPASSVDVAARLRKEGKGLFSAVLHTAPSSAGQMRALRGGLLLKFPPDWDQRQVESWVAKHELQGLRKLTLGPGWYGVTTEPGVEGLKLARKLMATGDVLEATPNWWREQRYR